MPTTAAREAVKGFPELLVVTIDDDDVSVSRGIWTSLDGSVRWDGIRARIAFVVIVERHRHPSLIAGNHHIRDTERSAVPVGAKVGMETGVCPDGGNDVV